MTTISYCAYSPDKQPLTPLDHDKIGLLNKGAPHDITSRVKDVVQRHLDYKGTEKFSVEFTRQKITFSLKSGSDVQNRTLTYVSGKWILSKNSAAPTALAPELQKEVDQIIDEVLEKIRNSHNAGAPVSRSRSYSSFDTSSPRYGSPPRFYPLETRSWGPRTASFESHSSRSFDSSVLSRRVEELESDLEESDLEESDQKREEALRTQRAGFDKHLEKQNAAFKELQDEVGILRKELAKLHETKAAQDKAALESKRKIDELEAFLEEKNQECDDLKSKNASEVETTDAAEELLKKTKASLKELQEKTQAEKAELQRQLLEAKEANGTKDEASHAAKEKIEKLEASVAEKEALLRENREHLETFKREATEAQKAIKSKLEDVKASLEELQGKALKQKAQLESQLRETEAELARLKETNAKALARAGSGLAALTLRNTALEERLAAASCTETKFAADIAGLQRQIEQKTAQLEEADRIAKADQKQMGELQTSLQSAAAFTEENTALKAQVNRLGIEAQKQAEELNRLSALLLETQRALQAERETTQQLQELLRLKELHRIAAREKVNMTEQTKEMLASMKAELGTSSRLHLPGETAVVKAADRKEEQ